MVGAVVLLANDTASNQKENNKHWKRRYGGFLKWSTLSQTYHKTQETKCFSVASIFKSIPLFLFKVCCFVFHTKNESCEKNMNIFGIEKFPWFSHVFTTWFPDMFSLQFSTYFKNIDWVSWWKNMNFFDFMEVSQVILYFLNMVLEFPWYS